MKKWTNEDAVVVHSESGDDKRALKNYKTNRTKNRPKWILAVGKISEGVDIKFLRVGVYLTTIQASLRWTQILGRILRTESELSHVIIQIQFLVSSPKSGSTLVMLE